MGRADDVALIPGSEHIWVAFWILTDDRIWRPQGFGTPMGAMLIESIPARIPFVAILAYAEDLGIVGEEFDRFLRLLRALDDEYLSILGDALRERLQRMQK